MHKLQIKLLCIHNMAAVYFERFEKLPIKNAPRNTKKRGRLKKRA